MKLFNKLCNLKRNEYVVVYGMRGCGKSTLVTQVLRGSPNLALFYFKVGNARSMVLSDVLIISTLT